MTTTDTARAWLSADDGETAHPGDREESHLQVTRRGWALVAFVTVLVILGWRYSPRQLNAVAAPAIAALLAGVVSVWRAECHAADVTSPRPGVPGETRTVVVDLEGSGLVTLGLDLPDGLALTGSSEHGETRAETTVNLPARIEWEVELEERGVYDLGPLEMRVHGPLGLVERHLDRAVETELVAYPRRYELTQPAAASGELHARHDVARQEFDRVREYQPGDPLRRVDWKASAKHRDLHVVEFADRAGQQSVTIAGVAARGNADRMAQTVATLAESALDAGLDVGVVVPDGRCEPGSGPAHRETLLRLLARTGASTEADGYTAIPSDVSEHEGDIIVDAGDPRIKRGPRETRVRTAYNSYALGELRAEAGGSDGEESRTAGADGSHDRSDGDTREVSA